MRERIPLIPRKLRRAVALRALGACALALSIGACIDSSPNAVVFDQLLESASFHNKLLTKVIVYRDDVPIDTMNAHDLRVYPINRKGAVRHAWRILAPIDNSGNRSGEQPYQDLGVQYRVRAEYTIDNDALDDGTLFTPRIANLSSHSLRITANYLQSDQRETNYIVGANSNSSLTHAPYFFWHNSSNIRLTSPIFGYSYQISRNDSNNIGQLRLDPGHDGSGVTMPIVIY